MEKGKQRKAIPLHMPTGGTWGSKEPRGASDVAPVPCGTQGVSPPIGPFLWSCPQPLFSPVAARLPQSL